MSGIDVAALRELHESSTMTGWDFSRLDGRLIADEPPWDFDADCLAVMRRGAIVDLGTGGGERLAELLSRLSAADRTVTATEGWEPNIPVAGERLAPFGVAVRPYDAEQGESMPFGDASIDVVMSRHEAVDAVEIARVLRPGGRFLTQQVDGRDAEQIHAWFDAPFEYPDNTSAVLCRDLEASGLRIDLVEDWRGGMEFADVAALVMYLGLVPWDAPGFTVDAHVDQLAQLDANRPIRVDQRRFRVHATKPRT